MSCALVECRVITESNMHRAELLHAILQTREDDRVSRGERRALRAVLEDAALDAEDQTWIRRELVRDIQQQLEGTAHAPLVDWLGDALNLLEQGPSSGVAPTRAWFGPSEAIAPALVQFIESATHQLDCCVFTITDDQVFEALVRQHKRGVRVRIVSDDDKSEDRGSDLYRLDRAGLACRWDDSPHHMHHKFAIADGRRLLNGSYNWTRSAWRANRENFMVTEEPALVRQYSEAFEAMWAEYG